MHHRWKADSPGENAVRTSSHAQAPLASRQQLFECIQANTASLLSTIRSYVLSCGLATGIEVQSVATEILQETVIEALTHADVYVATAGRPMAWLLGIAVNMIRRRRAAQAKTARREFTLSRLVAQYPEVSDEDELLEKLLPPMIEYGPEQEVESREQVSALLALVPDEDQFIIRLALLEDFKRAGLAARLGISPNAARMRLQRALARLRTALEVQRPEPEGEERHV